MFVEVTFVNPTHRTHAFDNSIYSFWNDCKFCNNVVRYKSSKFGSAAAVMGHEGVSGQIPGGKGDEFVFLSHIIQMRHLYLDL